MNERIQELYSQSFVPTPPVRGTARLTQDILWEQADHFDPDKFAELIILECKSSIYSEFAEGKFMTVEGCYLAINEHFGVK